MRQGLLAGLIVVTFGLPLAVVADSTEFVREYGALRAAIGGDTGPFKAIWMTPAATAAALPAPKKDEVAAIQQWAAWQLAQARAHPETVRTSAVAPSAFMIDMQRLAFARRNSAEAAQVTRQLMSFRGAALATVASLDDSDIPALPDAEDGLAHWQLGDLADQFSIAAYAEEAAASRAMQSPATPDVTSRIAASATNGGEDAAGVAPASPPFTIVASAAEKSAANSSGFVDIVQSPAAAGFVGAVPIAASVHGLIDVSVLSN